MAITLLEAAKATGVSKSALLKAIKAGRLSAHRGEVGGNYSVDPAELFRVYPPATSLTEESGPAHTSPLILEEKVRGLEREVSRLENERNYLRQNLASETTERMRLSAILTDQRTTAHPPVESPHTTPWVAYVIAFCALVTAGGVVWFLVKTHT